MEPFDRAQNTKPIISSSSIARAAHSSEMTTTEIHKAAEQESTGGDTLGSTEKYIQLPHDIVEGVGDCTDGDLEKVFHQAVTDQGSSAPEVASKSSQRASQEYHGEQTTFGEPHEQPTSDPGEDPDDTEMKQVISPWPGASLRDRAPQPERPMLTDDGAVSPKMPLKNTTVAQEENYRKGDKLQNKSHWTSVRSMMKAKRRLEKGREARRGDLDLDQYVPEQEVYRRNVVRLAKKFPDFNVVTAATVRHIWSTRIVFYDYTNAFGGVVRRTRHEPWRERRSAPLFSDFTRSLRTVDPDCAQRVILVEDLDPTLIDMLGATFEISPQVFAEHLNRSGYNPGLEKEEGIKVGWNIGSSAQGHMSIAWYRPVLPLLPVTTDVRTRLTTDGSARVRYPSNESGAQDYRNTLLRTTTNIWRSNLNLCPEPGVYHKGSKPEYPVGWDERATIWTREIDTCKFTIILLDPLPSLTRDTGSGVVSDAHPPRILRLLNPDARLQFKVEELARNRRISVALQSSSADKTRDWIAQTQLSTPAKTEAVEEAMSSSPIQVGRKSQDASSVPQGQRASNLAKTSSPRNEVDRMRAPPVIRNPANPTGATEDLVVTGGDPKRLEPDQAYSSGNKDNKTAANVTFSGPSEVKRHRSPHPGQEARLSEPKPKQWFRKAGGFTPYQPVKARLSSLSKVSSTFTAALMQQHVENLQVPTSTLEEFEYLFSLSSKEKETSFEPLQALCRVIHDDTASLVDIIRMTLRSVREGTLDEDLMQKRVTFWRSLLHQLNFSLADLDQRLHTFIEFISDSQVSKYSKHQESQSMKLANSTHTILQYCIELIERCSSSLLAEMQIVDSRRSIAEAESISKLTELAFVFIPLSFVASLFSMQIRELSGGVSVYLFVLVAIIFVVVAYTVRLSIRSSRLAEHKNRMLQHVREESGLQYNQSIPTHIFLVSTGRMLGTITWTYVKKMAHVGIPSVIIMALFAALISPIALLWLRGIDKGFSAVITVLLLILDLILLHPFADSFYIRSPLNPRKIIRQLRKDRAAKKLWKERAQALRRDGLDPEALSFESEDPDARIVRARKLV